MNSTLFTVHAGWLIDGSGAPARKDRLLTIRDGRFQAVDDLSAPRAPNHIDLSGCTVFPALVDSHVHLVMSGTLDPVARKAQLESTYSGRRETIARHLRDHFHCGVLAVRDGGDNNGDSLRYRQEVADHDASLRVAIASPGRARRAAGRYGKLIAIPVEAGTRLVESAFASLDDTRRNHLKLVNSGLNSLTQFGMETPSQFDAASLSEVVSAARRHGQPVMVHANGVQPVKMAVEAGCSSIEHGFFMGRDNMRRMADTGVVWIPTAVTMKAYSDYLKRQGHRSDPSFAEISRRNLDHQLEQIAAARELGVILAVGTDAGSPGVHHGHSLKEEIQLFMAAGYGLEGAICCASRNGARLMGLDDRGEIAAGMRADFLAVAAPPQELIDAWGRFSCRVVAGERIDGPEREPVD